MRRLWRQIQYLLQRDRHARELNEEMEAHLAYRADRLRELGTSEEQARIRARRVFGNRASLEVASDAAWGWGTLERLFQDVRLAIRSLRRTPMFTAVTVVTLAVGLGMNTAIFTIVNAVMLRNLPYPEPDRLVSLWEINFRPNETQILNSRGSNLGASGGANRTTVAPANLADYRAVQAFESLAGLEQKAMNFTSDGPPERLTGESVTAGYFGLLGVKPQRGRTFTDEEDRAGGPDVVVVSHDFWQTRLGGDTAVTSRSIVLDGIPRSIIGVMPPNFSAATQFSTREPVEFWVPAAYPADLLAQRGDHEINVIGRLRRSVRIEEAQQELNAVSARLAAQFPNSNKAIGASIGFLRDDLVRSVRDSLSALWAASAFIVLIACVNVANLLLVRAVGRRHETGVRMALGAGRLRVGRQFVVESLVIAGLGCIAGFGLAAALMKVLIAAAPPSIPRLDGVTLDWSVFAACAVVATLTGLAFGLAPALQASRTAPGEIIKSSERKSASRVQARWRAILAVTEVALAVILIVGAGLFLKSFTTIMGMELGFRTDNVLAMNINLSEPPYTTAERRFAFFDDLEKRVRALPGVKSAAFANRFPLRGGWGTGIEVEGSADSTGGAQSQAVSPGYFETLDLRLLRGRRLTPADRSGRPFVGVVNQAFERRFLNGSDAIGHHFRRGPRAPWVEIVGIVNDIRRGGKTEDVGPQIYLAAAQTNIYPVRLADFAVRTTGDPHLLVNAIQQQVWAIDRNQPVTRIRTMQEIIDRSVSEQRFQMLLLIVFAGVAAVLALIGISGVLSYSVDQRRGEIGVRMALGAAPASIVSMVLKQAFVMAVTGVILGAAGALAVTRLVANLLFRVQPGDPLTYIVAGALLIFAALAAALIPALRGSRLDPIEALRYE